MAEYLFTVIYRRMEKQFLDFIRRVDSPPSMARVSKEYSWYLITYHHPYTQIKES
jgi:hypothetical protein